MAACVISSVLKDQPAERAGLRRNDVIVEFDGQPVTDLQKFRLKVADAPVGSRVPMVVLRDGKRIPVTVTLGPRDQNVVASNEGGSAPAEPAKATDISGLRVRDMTPEEKTQAEVKNGVVVTDVKEDSAADDAGLSPNDVIEEGATGAERGRFHAAPRMPNRRQACRAVVHRGGNTQSLPPSVSDKVAARRIVGRRPAASRSKEDAQRRRLQRQYCAPGVYRCGADAPALRPLTRRRAAVPPR